MKFRVVNYKCALALFACQLTLSACANYRWGQYTRPDLAIAPSAPVFRKLSSADLRASLTKCAKAYEPAQVDIIVQAADEAVWSTLAKRDDVDFADFKNSSLFGKCMQDDGWSSYPDRIYTP